MKNTIFEVFQFRSVRTGLMAENSVSKLKMSSIYHDFQLAKESFFGLFWSKLPHFFEWGWGRGVRGVLIKKSKALAELFESQEVVT